jgi:post-segregation antitoxin (ccd killing protein)
MTTAKTKVSITLPPDLAERAKVAAGPNLSDFMADAVRLKLMTDGMQEWRRLRAAEPADDFFEAAEADAA